MSVEANDKADDEYTPAQLGRARLRKAKELVREGKATCRTAIATDTRGRKYETPVYKLRKG